MANQYLALSMFVMLLSFFIILNSMSNFEDSKSQEVLSSLDMAFSSGKVDRQKLAHSVQESSEKSNKEGSTLDKIEGAFENHIRNFKVTKNRLGTEMRITLPLEEFEEALNLTQQSLQTGRSSVRDNSFLSMLVSLIQSEETSIPYRMDMILKTGDSPARLRNEAPETLQNYANKAASFSRILEQSGLPKRFMSTGVAGGQKDFVELLFRRYEPVAVGIVAEMRENDERNQ